MTMLVIVEELATVSRVRLDPSRDSCLLLDAFHVFGAGLKSAKLIHPSNFVWRNVGACFQW